MNDESDHLDSNPGYCPACSGHGTNVHECGKLTLSALTLADLLGLVAESHHNPDFNTDKPQ